MTEQLRNFIMASLDDDHGISETAWQELCIFLQTAGELELLGEVSSLVDACDGRFFIK